MKRNHSGKVRRKRVRSRIRWAMVLVLVLAMGLLAEYVRLELGAGAVTVTAPFRPQYSANEDPGSSIDLAKICAELLYLQSVLAPPEPGRKLL